MRREVVRADGGDGTRRPRTGAVTLAAAGALLLVGLWPVPAAAQPSPSPTGAPEEAQIEVPEPVAGEEVCTAADPRLVELSGLIATEDGFIVVNDSQDFDDTLRSIFFLDSDCAVVDEQVFPSQPRDPEDLAVTADGATLWVADTGDNVASGGEGEPRPTVALWQVDLSGGDRTPVIYRFVYPDGEPRDAEAMLLDSDGTPIIVTRSVGAAELYIPTDLQPNNPPEQAVPLERVGEFTPPDTGSDNPFGAPGRQVITGGAVAPDGSRVALRSYADAFEFDVNDGDIVAAVTEGTPRVTPLPEEPQGEAIAYTPDGSQFLTVSEVPPNDTEYTPVILSYTPTPPEAEPPPAQEGGAAADDSGGGGFSLVGSVQDIINLIAAVGVLGLLLVAAGVFGIIRARRRGAGGGEAGQDGPGGGDGAAAGAPVTGRARIAAGEPRSPQPGWEPGQGQSGGARAAAAGGAAAAGAAGVYSSRAAGGYDAGYDQPAAGDGYQSNGYAAQGGHGGREYAGGEAGGGEYGGREYGGREYGGDQYPAGGGYTGAGYDGEYDRGTEGYGQDPYAGGRGEGGYGPTGYGGGGHHPGEYGGAGYGGSGHGGGYPEQGYDQGWENGHGGYPTGQAGGYSGEAGARAPAPPEGYSDDPDYPYEFRREQERW